MLLCLWQHISFEGKDGGGHQILQNNPRDRIRFQLAASPILDLLRIGGTVFQQQQVRLRTRLRRTRQVTCDQQPTPTGSRQEAAGQVLV